MCGKFKWLHGNTSEYIGGRGSTIPKTGEREGGGGGFPPFQGPQGIHLNNYTFHNISCNL